MIKLILLLFLTIPMGANAQYNFWHGMMSSQKKSWPFGLEGSLIVESGITTTISSKQIYDYQNIWVKSGGTLIINQISGKEQEPVYLGASKSIVIDGTLRFQVRYQERVSQTYTAPDETSVFSYSLTLSRGGNGGLAHCGISSGGSGGAPFGGGGGGVFGAPSGATADYMTGGVGPYPGCSAPGHRGGDGGDAGINGGILYLKTHGTISGTGLIDLRGNNGTSGDSASPVCHVSGSAGGGGGGGGGSGGKLFYTSASTISVSSVLVTAGSGASGGSPTDRNCTNGGPGAVGYGGTGSSGSIGFIQKIQ